jgi:uncharacterized protein (TIGR02001 family)
MKTSLAALAAALVVAALPGLAQAADEHTFAFNVGAVTDYRYRGISQTRFKPALQGGADYSHSSGFYVGTWASTIKWIKDWGGDANIELDIYGGYKGAITEGLSFDVGVLQYVYPSAKTAAWDALYDDPNTTEVYGAITFGPATLKYSHTATNLFGTRNSKNSGYLDASATFDLGGGIMLTPHVGYQKVAKNDDYSYTDYSVTVSKDFSGFVVSAAVVGTDTKSIGGAKAYASPANGKDLGKAGVVVGVKYNF